MSLSYELNYIERHPNKWFYVMQRPYGPMNAWDWREDAFAVGPFRTEQDAMDHHYKKQIHNGGSTHISNSEYHEDEIFKTLLDNAFAIR